MNNEPIIMQTYSGKYVDITDLSPESILMEDISRSLSNQCRFGGHTCSFYSVAEHSVIASFLAEHFCINYPMEMQKLLQVTDRQFREESKDYIVATLMHDASEAYLSDVITPVKRKLNEYMIIEYNIQRNIESILSIMNSRPESNEAIKVIDHLMLCIESVTLMKDSNDIMKEVFPSLPQFMQEWFKEANTDNDRYSWAFPEPLLPDDAMVQFTNRFEVVAPTTNQSVSYAV